MMAGHEKEVGAPQEVSLAPSISLFLDFLSLVCPFDPESLRVATCSSLCDVCACVVIALCGRTSQLLAGVTDTPWLAPLQPLTMDAS